MLLIRRVLMSLMLVYICGNLAIASAEEIDSDVDSADTVLDSSSKDTVKNVRGYVIDTPIASTLGCGSYLMALRFSSGGDITPEFSFGILKALDLGIAWKLGKFVGGNNIKMDYPAIMVKYKIYDGNMMIPSVVVGCDTQGCFSKDDYFQKGKGLYVVAGRELFVDNLMLNIGFNVNEFPKVRVHGFTNITFPLYKEKLFLMGEYDAKLNLGLRIAIMKHIDVDCIVKDCWGKNDKKRIPNERVFRVSYSIRF